MTGLESIERLRPFTIPGLVSFHLGQGGLPKTDITTNHSRAEIYLHGAHVTSFQKHGEPPLLFLSQASRFEPGKAIRGGVPICFPWFGPRPGNVAHGFARITSWEVTQVQSTPDGGAVLRFILPADAGEEKDGGIFHAQYTVTVHATLTLELAVTNRSPARNFAFEDCLHTYFGVGDVSEIHITGLESAPYLDNRENDARHQGSTSPIRINAQTDRTYLDAAGIVEIHDPTLRRKIIIAKSGSQSTVVWNPWTTQFLPDIGPEEYRRMVCVESGNVRSNQLILEPGQTATVKATLETQPRTS